MPGGAGTPGGYQGDMDWDEGGGSPINGGKGSGHAAATAAVNQDPSGLDHGNISTHTATTKGPNGGSGGKAGIDYKKHAVNAGVSQVARLLGAHPLVAAFVAPAIRRGSNRRKNTSLKTEQAPKLRPPTGANFVTGTVEHGGDGPGPQMTATSAQAAQPIKPKTQPIKTQPYHMGFDFQQAKHKLGTSGQLMPDPRKRTYQGWEFKKGGLAGGKRFGPPPKKGPNPHGKCPFRPDGIRGVGAVEKGRGVKFIGTK